jgi:hypothetical protein
LLIGESQPMSLSRTTPQTAALSELAAFLGRAFIKPPQNSRADNLLDLVQKGAYPGVQTPLTPDEHDDSMPEILWKGLG